MAFVGEGICDQCHQKFHGIFSDDGRGICPDCQKSNKEQGEKIIEDVQKYILSLSYLEFMDIFINFIKQDKIFSPFIKFVYHKIEEEKK